MTDTPTPGAPAPIPDPETAPHGAVLLDCEVPGRLVGFDKPIRLRVIAAKAWWCVSPSGINVTAHEEGLGERDPDLDAIVRVLIDRVRAAEARVAELEAAYNRPGLAALFEDGEAGEGGR